VKNYSSKILMKVRKFLTTALCRRKILLDYFATDVEKSEQDSTVCEQQSPASDLDPNCCDNCTRRLKSMSDGGGVSESNEPKDYSDDALKFLNAVKLLGQRFGSGLVISFILGSVCIFLSR
jgi:Werner syndrome ATP-dependent helicase